MPGFEAHTPQDVSCRTVIVHGWRDDIVPVDNSIRWARKHRAELHVLDSDHRLEDRIEEICRLLRSFLTGLN
jgi:pimeloyl-ACP methyl ester carboxylesterase